MPLGGVAQGMDVMQDLSLAAEHVRARQKFVEENTAVFVVIAGKGDDERKIVQENSGGKVTTPKGVDCPTNVEDFDGIDGNLVI
jgi:hypothetical protein